MKSPGSSSPISRVRTVSDFWDLLVLDAIEHSLGVYQVLGRVLDRLHTLLHPDNLNWTKVLNLGYCHCQLTLRNFLS